MLVASLTRWDLLSQLQAVYSQIIRIVYSHACPEIHGRRKSSSESDISLQSLSNPQTELGILNFIEVNLRQ